MRRSVVSPWRTPIVNFTCQEICHSFSLLLLLSSLVIFPKFLLLWHLLIFHFPFLCVVSSILSSSFWPYRASMFFGRLWFRFISLWTFDSRLTGRRCSQMIASFLFYFIFFFSVMKSLRNVSTYVRQSHTRSAVIALFDSRSYYSRSNRFLFIIWTEPFCHFPQNWKKTNTPDPVFLYSEKKWLRVFHF